MAISEDATISGAHDAEHHPGSDAQARQTISDDEIALYDRQIRLWGVKAQEKLRTAHVLLVTMRALGNEVAKNLVLAGIGTVTIMDPDVVLDEDLCAQFLVSTDDIGKSRAKVVAASLQKLNPRVRIHASNHDIRWKNTEYFVQFDVVIVMSLDLNTLAAVNYYTRLANRPLYAADAHGLHGYIFADLIRHDFVIERAQSNIPTKIGPETPTRSILSTATKKENGKVIELVNKRETYHPISVANSAPLPREYIGNRRKLKQVTPLLALYKALWEFGRIQGRFPVAASSVDLEAFTRISTQQHQGLQLPVEDVPTSGRVIRFLRDLGAEFAPVTAFLGGLLAQDVINVLGQREQPIQNLMLFDAEESVAPIYALYPDEDTTPATAPGATTTSHQPIVLGGRADSLFSA